MGVQLLQPCLDVVQTHFQLLHLCVQRVQFLDKRGGEQGGMPSGAGGSEGGYSAPRRPAAAQQGGGSRPQQRPQQRQDDYEDLGPAFPSEASGMDDVPF